MIISPLKVWVQNILPVVYDDSLSYLEIVAKINAKTNEIIGQTNENTHAIETLASTIAELGDIDELRALLDEMRDIIDNLYTTDVPIMDGTASAGSADHAARSDHVHPSDTSKAPVNHASNENTYGTGDADNYGHVKITDNINNADTGTAVKASVVKTVNDKLSTFAKDNILDNWYFGNPVNQRGLSIYNISNSQTMTIDRWFGYDGGQAGKIEVTSDGVSITKTSGGDEIYFGQKLEQDLTGETATFTVLTSTGTLFTGSAVIANNVAFISAWPNIRGSALIENGHTVIQIYVYEASLTIKAVKLELGSEQTLAHQENGQWVLNEIPDYGEELAKCQRYFYHWIGAFYVPAFSNGECYGCINHPVKMAGTPSITNVTYNTGWGVPDVPTVNEYQVVFHNATMSPIILSYDATIPNLGG